MPAASSAGVSRAYRGRVKWWSRIITTCSACSATADPETIKAAYRKLAKEHHPDRHNGCSDAEAQFKAISEAYECLKDPQKRAAYDRFGKAAFQNGGGGDPFGGAGGFESFSDIFSSIFGEFADRAEAAPEPGARRRPSLRSRTDARGSLRRHRSEHLGRGAGAVRDLRRPRLQQHGRIARRPAARAAAPAGSARSRASSWSSAAARPAAEAAKSSPTRAMPAKAKAARSSAAS